MSGQKHRHPLLGQGLEHIPDDQVALDIEARCRFVKEEEAWIVDQSHRKGKTAFHPLRKSLDPACTPVPEAEDLEKFFSAFLAILLPDMIELPGEHHVLPCGDVIVDVRGLIHDAHLLPGPDGIPDDISPEDGGRSSCRGRNSGQDTDCGGLAGAVRPEVTEDFACLNGKTDVVESEDLTKPLL
ncbi:MAG: hypothetical protein A4E38_01058 [Methanoregulaceae archaeon PtaB.Bin108]|nr:MAG: hypothetical protein A4E38_01058 [Methanoregulaceae archaeon PtaB.Bin108]